MNELKLDKRSWELGYQDGYAGHHKNEKIAVDQLAYSSGWIEGEASAQSEPEPENEMKM